MGGRADLRWYREKSAYKSSYLKMKMELYEWKDHNNLQVIYI